MSSTARHSATHKRVHVLASRTHSLCYLGVARNDPRLWWHFLSQDLVRSLCSRRHKRVEFLIQLTDDIEAALVASSLTRTRILKRGYTPEIVLRSFR